MCTYIKDRALSKAVKLSSISLSTIVLSIVGIDMEKNGNQTFCVSIHTLKSFS